MFATRTWCLILTAMASVLLASRAPAQERPVAIVIAGEGGTWVRPPGELDLSLHRGDVLFTGDRIHTGDPVRTTLLFCPAGIAVDLAAGVSAEIGRANVNARGGGASHSRQMAPCELPRFDPFFRAALYHRGASLFGPPEPRPPGASPASEQAIEALLSRLATDERNKAEADALTASSVLASLWPEAPQWKARLFQHGEAVAASRQTASPRGKGTYAIVIGISKFKGPQASQLDFADRDAQMIYQYLTNPRGGDIAKARIRLLINGEATAAAIREAFSKVKSAGADRLVVFIASHGMEVGREAYIVATDTNPQNAVATAIPMSEINHDLTSELAGLRSVIAWIDACHAGHVALNGLDAPPNGVLFGYAASEPRKPSFEDPKLGGGHGVFTWFLNQALTGGVAESGPAKVYDLVDFVHDKVASFTGHDQIPQKFGNIDQKVTLASLNLGDPGNPAPAARPGTLIARELDQGDELTDHENRGQNVVLQYLEGDESPVSRDQFAMAESEFAAARRLAPESLWLEAREAFCAGRIAIFDKQYDRAIPLLDRAIQLDPSDALAYNAMGVLWLERADYTRALAAFDDAIRRAPDWAYPWHNRALAYTQSGNYNAAIRSYQHAIGLAPYYFYLPYNLGVLYQTLNRRKDAEEAYLTATRSKDRHADPYNALGTLYAGEGKREKAEENFRKALEIDPRFEIARQNLEKLLNQGGKRR